MKPRINPFWGFLTLILALLTLGLCLLGAAKGTLLVRADTKPQDAAEQFFEAVVIGKYEAADAGLENYSGLGLDRSPRTEQGKQIWSALLASYTYSLEGEPKVMGDTAVQTVRLRYLDRNALERAMTPAPGEEAPELTALLEHPEDYYSFAELEVTLHYVDGRWLVYADEALLTALSGGK